MTKPDKSQLITELETSLTPSDYKYNHTEKMCFVVDAMANIRKVRIVGLPTFHSFASSFSKMMAVYHRFGRCDCVFDLYSDRPLVKDSERMHRVSKKSVEVSTIKPHTPIPKDTDTFWPSKLNKSNLEMFIYNHIKSNLPAENQYPSVLGQVTSDGECSHCVSICKGTVETLLHLNSTLEEADLRILMHVADCVKNGYIKCTVLSSDTDVIVALLHHMKTFAVNDLQELWVRAEAGDKTRYPYTTFTGS